MRAQPNLVYVFVIFVPILDITCIAEQRGKGKREKVVTQWRGGCASPSVRITRFHDRGTYPPPRSVLAELTTATEYTPQNLHHLNRGISTSTTSIEVCISTSTTSIEVYPPPPPQHNGTLSSTTNTHTHTHTHTRAHLGVDKLPQRRSRPKHC